MKLLLIIPIHFNDPSIELKVINRMRDHVSKVTDTKTELHIRSLPKGATASIESRLDRNTNSRYVIQMAVQAEEEGFDGIFVSDMDMCGVDICREVVDIPVIGGFRACASTAMLLAGSFSIITILDNVLSMQKGHIHHFGMDRRFTSIRVADIPVCDLIDNPLPAVPALVSESIEAIKDGAEAIIFGCTGFINVASQVQKKLELAGYPVPVIDPNQTAVKQLELLVSTGQSQSRRTYMKHHAGYQLAKAI